MNKKIYFHNKFIMLSAEAGYSADTKAFKTFHDDGKDALKQLLDEFLDASNTESILLITSDMDKTFSRLKKSFSYIEAAGGFIEKDSSFLFIHRHGRWDLPKGKLEKGESIEEGAVRECEEECGVKELNIIHALPSTFHIYAYKDGFALKQTYWFYMQTHFAGTLVPQQEEDIDQVKWFDRKAIEASVLADTYYTIADTVRHALNISA